jgi:hypothetical protein
MINLLSCGGGVQSTTLLLMSCKGVLPKLDHVIFSDTGWEPTYVYENVNWLKEYSSEFGIPFSIVGNKNIKEENINKDGKFFSNMPVFTINQEGKVGILKRQCTSIYKIAPITSFITKEILKLGPREGRPKYPVLYHWFGISVDEIKRCRLSRNAWSINCYPLIEDFNPPMSREDCKKWCLDNGYKEPPRSACVGCPYKTDHEWRLLKLNHPEMFQEAVEFDKQIRHKNGMKQPCFLHFSCVPLDEVAFDSKQQKSLFNMECSGICST